MALILWLQNYFFLRGNTVVSFFGGGVQFMDNRLLPVFWKSVLLLQNVLFIYSSICHASSKETEVAHFVSFQMSIKIDYLQ